MKNCWTISTSFDIQAHLQRSKRGYFSQTMLLCFEVLSRLVVRTPRYVIGTPRLVIGPPRHVVSAPWLVVGARRLVTSTPRCSQACLWRSKVFSNLSQSLQWYFCRMHQKSQLLRWPARISSYSPTHFWNWPILVYTPHPLRLSWRLPVRKIHFADIQITLQEHDNLLRCVPCYQWVIAENARLGRGVLQLTIYLQNDSPRYCSYVYIVTFQSYFLGQLVIIES